MARQLRRAWFARLAVVAAVFALPLLASSVAQAGIAGSNQPTTTGRPDLRSFTLTSATSAEVCFDKTLNSGAIFTDGDGFWLAGYRSHNHYKANSAAVDPTNGDCVIVGFPSSVGDPNQYTVGTVTAGTVQDNLTSLTNNGDSVGLTGSTSNNGTTGHTTGPDLNGILTPSGTDQANNNLEFVFDQAIAQSTVYGTNFYFVDTGGNICFGDNSATNNVSNSAAGATVTIHFPKPCTAFNTGNSISSINSAVRGGVKQTTGNALSSGAITAANDANGFSAGRSDNPVGSAIIPGNSSGDTNGITTLADLTSATLGPTGDTVTYNFTSPVVINDSTEFAVVMSTGDVLFAKTGTASLGSNGTSVTVSFGSDLSTQDEYAVKAAVYGCTPGGSCSAAVEPQANPTDKYTNAYESVDLGDNSGALGRGFTTGADVFGVVFNATNGTVTADLDQRITSFDKTDICILNSAGDMVANPNPVSADIPVQAAGPQAVTLHFVSGPTGPVAQGTMIAFSAQCDGFSTVHSDAFYTPLDMFDQNSQLTNIDDDQDAAPQIVAPVASGARLHAYKHSSKHHRHHRSHKNR
jgi:hypothetical protein